MGRAWIAGALLLIASRGAAQATPGQREFVSYDRPTIAIRHARLIDGTGAPALDDQTILIDKGNITAVGRNVAIPGSATIIDATGRTVIPGLVGLHDHMYHDGRNQRFAYPKLFLAAGVTTIRTTGATDSYEELIIKREIDDGLAVGPSVYVTGPYLDPRQGTVRGDPENARSVVRYWVGEGVTWFKAYMYINRAQLAAAIDEAHRAKVKVSAHLCAVTFAEAAALGIDNLEHGLLTATDFIPGKVPDQCPTADNNAVYAALDIGSASVRQVIQDMVQHHVALTSTLAILESYSPSRVPRDPRVLAALSPTAQAVAEQFYVNGATAADAVQRQALRKAMDFERAFVAAGGLLAAGSDPCCGAFIAGYADQRNYVLLIEAGFSPEEVVHIMTANGAQVLGGADRFGAVRVGLDADLVLLNGDLTKDPAVIQRVVTVFRHGVGYDAAKLQRAVEGRVGIP